MKIVKYYFSTRKDIYTDSLPPGLINECGRVLTKDQVKTIVQLLKDAFGDSFLTKDYPIKNAYIISESIDKRDQIPVKDLGVVEYHRMGKYDPSKWKRTKTESSCAPQSFSFIRGKIIKPAYNLERVHAQLSEKRIYRDEEIVLNIPEMIYRNNILLIELEQYEEERYIGFDLATKMRKEISDKSPRFSWSSIIGINKSGDFLIQFDKKRNIEMYLSSLFTCMLGLDELEYSLVRYGQRNLSEVLAKIAELSEIEFGDLVPSNPRPVSEEMDEFLNDTKADRVLIGSKKLNKKSKWIKAMQDQVKAGYGKIISVIGRDRMDRIRVIKFNGHEMLTIEVESFDLSSILEKLRGIL